MDNVKVNVVGDREWEELETAVDSGASETVVSDDVLGSIETVEGDAKKRGEVRGGGWHVD